MWRRLIAGGVAIITVAAACSSGATQPPDPSAIAFLKAVASGESSVIFEELRRAGFVRGESLVVLDDDPDLIYVDPEETSAALRRWQREGVDLIFAFSTSGARAAADTVPGVPVVSITNDPVASGLVSDPARPGGSITGVTFRVPADRTLDLAARAIPGLKDVGLVLPSEDPAARPHHDAVMAAAGDLGLRVHAAPFTDDPSGAVAALPPETQAVFVSNSPTAVRAATAIVSAATARRLPVIANSSFVRGAVVVLEPDTAELLRQLARQATRILRGVAPAAVPVEDPIRYRVVIDMEAADALGVVVSDHVLREADEVKR